MDSVPEAKFGTLWFSDPNNDLSRVGSLSGSVTTYERAMSIAEMLQANIGSQVELYLEKITEPLRPARVEMVQDLLVHVSVEEKWFVFAPSQIQRVVFLENKPSMVFEKVESKPILNLDFATKQAKEHELNIMYLRDKMGWLPNYSIEMIGEDRASISLRAVVLNDAEDIENTTMNFVVGSPRFLYTSILSPLTGACSIPKFFQDFSQCQQYGGMKTHRQAYCSPEGPDSGYTTVQSAPAGAADVEAVAGSDQEDLFYYTAAESVSMKKNERAFINLLKAECPLQHIYEVNLETEYQPTTSTDGGAASFRFSEEYKDKVYHLIKLLNDSDADWTTGTAMITRQGGGAAGELLFDENKPICQDMMNFTPRLGQAKIKLNVAPDITVQYAEVESSRVNCKNDNSVAASTTNRQQGHCTYAKITGQIKIRNFKKKSIFLRINRRLPGEILKGGGECGRAVVSTNNGKSCDVSWELRLEPGEKKTLTYVYGRHIWVYNR
jgi:hypothetical protein